MSIKSTGLVTLFEDGLVKAAAGIVSLGGSSSCLCRFGSRAALKDLQRAPSWWL